MIRLQVPSFVFVYCLFTCLLSAEARAELTVIEDAEGQQGLTVFKMTVSPAAEPVPALKHRLTLRELDLVPGNAATFYMRGSTLENRWRAVRKKYGDESDDWYDIDDVPLDELPLEKLHDAAAIFGNLTTFCLRPASRCKDCNWGLGLETLRGMEIYNLLLPEFQESRAYSRILSMLTRLALAESRYDDAIDYMRMNYRLAYNVGRGPFFVCGLIGIAEVGMSNLTAIDLIAANDSPNLYWALTELPNPVVDLRHSVRIEMSLLQRVITPLENVEAQNHTTDEWSRILHQAFREFKNAADAWDLGSLKGLPKHDTFREVLGTALTMLVYPDAKQRLMESGMSAEAVETMPTAQVILIDTAREVRRAADELEKWFYLDYPLAHQRMKKAVGALDRRGVRGGLGQPLADFLLPAIQAAQTANARMRWQLNALRTLEALRMHAAEVGRFPASLDEIEVVPVPRNPITVRHFLYRLDGEIAVLELPFSDGIPGVSWRFEIQLGEK